MIDGVVHFVENELNSFLKRKMSHTEERVLSSNLVNQDGSIAVKDQNRIVLTVIDLEEESSMRNSDLGYLHGKTRTGSQPPPVYLNIYLMFSAYFSVNNYKEALRYISEVIAFFQSRRIFNHTEYPDLTNAGVQHISFEMYHPDYQTKNNLWTILGVKYMPSVIYKIRTMRIEDQRTGAELPPVKGIDKN